MYVIRLLRPVQTFVQDNNVGQLCVETVYYVTYTKIKAGVLIGTVFTPQLEHAQGYDTTDLAMPVLSAINARYGTPVAGIVLRNYKNSSL